MELAPFLVPLDDAAPSGSELRNDGRFHAIERLLEPAARTFRLENVKSGGTGIAAVDWPDVLSLCEELAGTGRDLRLLVIVVRALANAESFAGLADGLAMLTQTVADHWPSMHPVLREGASPSEAATRRVNSLYQLQNADNGLLCDLEFHIVLNPRVIGPITGADLAVGGLNRNVAQSEMPSGLSDKEMAELMAKHDARANRVTAACRAEANERPEQLAELVASIEGALAALNTLEAALNVHVSENGVGVRFKDLEKLLSRILAPLKAVQAGTVEAVPEESGLTEEELTMMAEPPPPERAMNGMASPPPSANGSIPGAVNSRRDVERCLDMIIDFYERTEPSSPIPHLARRMRKMVPMNFIQLMEEIAPSGMKEFKNVAGVDDKTKSAPQ
jgi:type VI secretion system protein ImpA